MGPTEKDKLKKKKKKKTQKKNGREMRDRGTSEDIWKCLGALAAKDWRVLLAYSRWEQVCQTVLSQ